jgi:hypothetical protein
MAEHRTHPTDVTADIPEADLLEQATPLIPITEIEDPESAPPPAVSPAGSLVDEADYLDQTIPVTDDDAYPHTAPTGNTDG